ncbi:MAG: mannose-1-phosphate guanylyltransferase [bacterium]|nr:mannose-1-phosphate guanylyltransferase [bacterium]
MIAVIMAGGSGKRFWPLSRRKNPKQFLRIVSEMSMIQMTVDRLLDKIHMKDIYVVTSAPQASLVSKHLPDLNKGNIIIEPEGMNTAPAIALSAQYLSRKYNKNETMFVLPADSIIQNVDKFIKSFEPAEKASDLGNLVTFGVEPTYPSIGYGYIEGGENAEFGLNVKSFKEKPDADTAKYFFDSGNYFWNSGMFMWKIDTILNSFSKYLPKVRTLLKEIDVIWEAEGVDADISYVYSQMPRIPVDIGIMEQAEKRVVVPVDYGWNDVGGWKALHEITEKDGDGNVFNCKHETVDSKDNYIHSEKFVALIGVNNLVIVDSPDILMISDADQSERVKDIVTSLEQKSLDNLL